MIRTLIIAFNFESIAIENSDRNIIIAFLKLLRRKGHTIIIWSNLSEENIRGKIESIALNDYIDFIIRKDNAISEGLYPDIIFDANDISLPDSVTVTI